MAARKKPAAPADAPAPAAKEAPPVWSAEYKAMILRGEITGGGNG